MANRHLEVFLCVCNDTRPRHLRPGTRRGRDRNQRKGRGQKFFDALVIVDPAAICRQNSNRLGHINGATTTYRQDRRRLVRLTNGEGLLNS